MKPHLRTMLSATVLLALLTLNLPAAPLGTAIKYNGHLRESGSAANGTYDVIFGLWDAESGGTEKGSSAFSGVTIEDGVFSVSPDFGEAFNGDAYWLEIRVQKHNPGNPDNYQTLTPRQPLGATAYALHAPKAAHAEKAATADKAAGVDKDAVHTDGLQDLAVTKGKLRNGAVGKDQLETDAVEQDKIKNGAVTKDKLAPRAVANDQLDENAVSEGKIDDNAVTAVKIKNGQVVKSLNDLRDAVTLSAGPNVVVTTPSSSEIRIAADTGWSLLGTAGTAAGLNFVGTTDDQPLELRVHNTRVMRYEPTTSSPNVIGGWQHNQMRMAGVVGITISGGGFDSVPDTGPNDAVGNFCTIGGGAGNLAGDPYSPEGPASCAFATVSGGHGNIATAQGAAIGGGFQNHVDLEATNAVVAGGQFNTISERGAFSSIIGGAANHIGADTRYAVIPGGQGNLIDEACDYAFAAGYRAQVNHRGAFVWSDSNEFDFPSMNENEFAVRATGGVRFVSALGIGGAPVAGVSLPEGAGSWSSLSDRSAKTGIEPVNCRSLLDSLLDLPLASWSYAAQDPAIRHIGPMAQDFAAAFKIGEDDKHITTIDADGVALAAIQGLNQKLESELQRRDAENAELKRELALLRERVDVLSHQPK
jgi:trimeric autotransporter adhesin